MKETIKATNAPAAIGPYSHAVLTGNLMFLSGQIAINPATGEMPDGIKEQTALNFRSSVIRFGGLLGTSLIFTR